MTPYVSGIVIEAVTAREVLLYLLSCYFSDKGLIFVGISQMTGEDVLLIAAA